MAETEPTKPPTAEEPSGKQPAQAAPQSPAQQAEESSGMSAVFSALFCCWPRGEAAAGGGGPAAAAAAAAAGGGAGQKKAGSGQSSTPAFVPVDRSLPPIVSGELLVMPAGGKDARDSL